MTYTFASTYANCRPILGLIMLYASGCSSSSGAGPSEATDPTGGTPASGGAVASATTSGGLAPNGGTKSTSGGSANSTGGRAATGGDTGTTGGIHSTDTGGTSTKPSATGGNSTGGTSFVSTGGAVQTGGTVTAGGTSATGGTFPTGGTRASGGTSGATGGTTTIGGSTGTGGTSSVPPCSNQISKCTGTNPISCHFGGNPGNYEVTVELGGATAGGMVVEAEMYRRMLGQTTTQAGQTKSFTFSVNVRQPEGQPVQNGPNDGTSGLDVYIRGTAPLLKSICYQPATKPVVLWIAGDSTVCDQSGTDYAGWGQHVPQFFSSPISVANYADSGESSGSFLNSSAMWGAITSRWKAGDWLLVQMGHNDKTTTAATFQSNMTAYVTQAKAAGVNIILVTPISRVGYTLSQEHVNSAGANLPQIIRDIAASQKVPLIDLTVTTWNWLQTLGNGWTSYFALGTDHTHTNVAGAEVVSGFVRDAVKSQNMGLAMYLR